MLIEKIIKIRNKIANSIRNKYYSFMSILDKSFSFTNSRDYYSHLEDKMDDCYNKRIYECFNDCNEIRSRFDVVIHSPGYMSLVKKLI